ncbi:hypothetical protein [Ruegeria lacuscaerulensis]|uniref:hypothetical protein n=1 Tax=Ruegeria lacuscaerulensis TaxID=55218 RepID=UPI00147D06FF|nr:hypothetical protein [Ruegeria lacuscaerulensis]
MDQYFAEHWAEIIGLIGLAITLYGAGKAALSLYTTPVLAGEENATRIMSNNPEDWKNTPKARAAVKQYKAALTGFACVAVGTFLQALPLAISLLF